MKVEHRYMRMMLFCCIAIVSSCTTTEISTQSSSVGTSGTQQAPAAELAGAVDDENICDSIATALSTSTWGEYGVRIENCGSVVADNGDDVFLLNFNDPAEWEDLILAMGDIPTRDAALYAFWRLPLGVLSIGFFIANESPNIFDQMVVSFDNPKQTVYDILPRDIAYVIDIPDSASKEEFSTTLNKRIDEVSERVDVLNLNE